MSQLNANFEELMNANIDGLITGADINEVTGHAALTFPESLYPEGITQDSLGLHVDFLNVIGSATEAATAKMARDAYEKNNDNIQFDSTLDFGFLQIQSQHFLKQDLGDNTLYGQSTTTMDYQHGEELSGWRDQMITANAEEAAKLFG